MEQGIPAQPRPLHNVPAQPKVCYTTPLEWIINVLNTNLKTASDIVKALGPRTAPCSGGSVTTQSTPASGQHIRDRIFEGFVMPIIFCSCSSTSARPILGEWPTAPTDLRGSEWASGPGRCRSLRAPGHQRLH
eukprot:scaffold653888_cov57-Prasinocladus_malaysianus.AAC.1